MILALDTEELSFLNPDNPSVEITALTVRRGDTLTVRTFLYMDDERITPPDASIDIFVTEDGDFTNLLTSSVDSVIVGGGKEGYFEGTISFDAAGIDTLFTSGAVDSITSTLEVRVTDGDGVMTSKPLLLTIDNSYIAP